MSCFFFLCPALKQKEVKVITEVRYETMVLAPALPVSGCLHNGRIYYFYAYSPGNNPDTFGNA